MFFSIARFELRYQLKNPIFWVAVVLFFLLSFTAMAVDQVHVGGDNGNIHRNAPFAVAQLHLIMPLFFMFASTALVANVVVRDDETGFGPILRSSRITKFDYLYGRFAGAFMAVLIAFLAVPFGVLIGAMSPWLDRETLGPIRLGDYAYAYLVLGAPSLFLTSALFFSVATATRSLMATYVSVVALLMIWMVSTAVTDRPEFEKVMAVAEPFGLAAYSVGTKYWTVAERNTLNLPLAGALLWSRLLWTAVAVAVLALAHRLYRFEAAGRARKPERLERADLAPNPTPLPAGALRTPGVGRTAWIQFVARTRLDMAQVFKSPAFSVLLALGVINASAGLWFTNSLYETDIYPVTRVMIGVLRGGFVFIPVIVAVYYAGDLVWRERDCRTEEIIDSTPAPDWVFAAPKVLAISLVLLSMLLTSVLAAMVVQAAKGWLELEPGKYLAWYVAPSAVTVIQIAVLAVFVQSLTPHKFIGYAVMLVYLVVKATMAGLHFEDFLYRYGSAPLVPLSDMNGEGQFGLIRDWFEGYWSAIALVLLILTYAVWRRGRNIALAPRLMRLPRRLNGAAGLALAAGLIGAIGLGGFIFYNTHILNTYRSGKDEEARLADYEKTLLRYESIPQPRISDVKLAVDLYPHEHRAVTRGVYVFQNRTGQPIRDLHVRFAMDVRVDGLSVEGARPKETFERFNYRIFTFDTPLAPGEHRTLSFQTERGLNGFRNDDNGWSRVYDNGTFLDDRDITPDLGMGREGLIQDRAKRRKYGLPVEQRMPKLEDEQARAYSLLGKDADWVNADITVSTVADQTPIAPGYRVSDRIEGGRRISQFKTDAPIQRFFSIQSAAYAVRSQAYKGVDLSVYYHPAHAWNVDRMIAALKASLDYDQANFSPYQFRQARVLEFPAYADFAQSFANTIPFSEGLGWILDARDPNKIDMVTYVTAHEIGHQWWAHQLIGANMQGATMLDETLAQYSALMVMEKLYGQAQIRKFLKYELDRYLRARGGDVVEELPLERVENQPYIHYRKGSLVMYRLKEELGEAAVNHALRTFLSRFAFRGAPYPTSKALVDLFRQEARPDQQALITDLFEKITLYDLKARSAHARRRADGRYDVTLNFEAHKLYADGHGKETEAPMDDWVDVGFFTREPGKDAYTAANLVKMQRIRVHSGQASITLILASPPKKAGIDPYNKLIDRNSDDNLVNVGL